MPMRNITALVCLWMLVFGLWPVRLTAHLAPPAPMRSAAAAQQSPNAPQVVSLVINEYMADPPPGIAGDANGDGTRSATQDEFIELVNSGATPLDISGFTVSDGTAVRFTVPAGKIIPAGEAAVVFGGGTPTMAPGAFGNAGTNGLVFTSSGLSLDNGGDTITVKDNTTAVVATLTYTATEGGAQQSITRSPDITGGFVKHSLAAGSGGSLFSPGKRVDGTFFTAPNPIIASISPDSVIVGSGDTPITVTGSNYQMASVVNVDGAPVTTMFQSATSLTATIPAAVINVTGPHAVTVQNPGPVNSNSVTFTVLAGLGINEYLADPPAGAAGDANGDGTPDTTQDEFVEIVNRTVAPVNVGGYTISDSTQVRFTFPANTMIPAGEVAVIFGGGTPTGNFGNAQAYGLVFAIGGSGLSLNNTGDTITLKDNSTATLESLTYGSTEGNADQSITRSPDITGGFVPHSTAPGNGGRIFSPGTRVDGTPFTTFIPTPTITSVSPNSAAVGSGNVPVVVTGTNYQAASVVRVDGTPITTSFQDAMTLNATVPASVTNQPGPHAVTVENPGPVTSNSVTFTVLGAITINEYLADPPAGPAGDANGDGTTDSAQDEFIEVINRTNGAVNVGGYTISDADAVRFTFPANTMIPAGEAAVIFGGGTPTGEFGNAHANGLVFTSTLSLNNTGDTITLKDNLNNVIESITYGSAEGSADQSINRNPDVTGTAFAPHTTIPGSGGRLFSPGTRVDGSFFTTPNPVIASITPNGAVVGSGDVPITVTGSHFQALSQVRIDGAMITTMFQSSTVLTATVPTSVTSSPGAHAVTVENPGPVTSNSVPFTVLAGLGINEYLADPPGSISTDLIGDANGDGTRSSSDDEFIEVINRTNAPVNVGGFTISDSTNVTFTFPPGTMIPAGEVAVIFGGGNPTGDFGNAHANGLVFTSPLSLNNTGDMIILKDSGSNIIESITFGPTEGSADQSINRNPDVTGISFAPHTTVPGNGGRLFSPGTRVDGSFFTTPNPTITSISPDAAIVGSGDTAIIVTGNHFQASSVVRVDGSPIATMFQSSTSLSATIPAAVLVTAGMHAITVQNPGPVNSNSVTFRVLATLGVNEYLADPPAGPAGDANGDGTTDSSQDEFIEVINRTNTAMNVGGFTISDADSVRFTFPTGTMIPAGEVAVIFGGGNPTGDFGNAHANGLVFTATLSLNNGGDTITLKDNASATIESITFGSTEGGADQAITRSPDITGNFVPHSTAPGSGGRLFSPGTRLDGSFFSAPNPVIASISPNAAIVGSGPTDIIVTGSHFQADSVVRVDGSPITTMFQGMTSLSATVPAFVTNTPGAHSVTVANPGPIVSNAVTFTVLATLGVNEYLADPPAGPAGDANGDGTTDSSQDEFVEVINRTNVPVNVGGYTVSDATQVRFTFPPGTMIPAGEVAVIFGGGTPTGEFGNAHANGLVFTATLSLNNGGDTITLKDSLTNTLEEVVFGSSEGNADQSINRNPDVMGTTFAPHTTIPGSAGRLFSPGTRVDGLSFTTGPRITVIQPSSMPLDVPPFDVSVHGSGFEPASLVFIDNVPVMTSFVSGSELTAHIPASVTMAGGPHPLQVRNEGGNRSNVVVLTIIPPPPHIIAIVPAVVPVGIGSFTLFVMGENFFAGAGVLIDGAPAATAFQNGHELRATIPAALVSTTGVHRVKVRSGDGQESNDTTFEVISPLLRVNSVSPNQAIAGGPGFTLTVTGANFKSGTSKVTFNNTVLATTFVSATQLRAEVPASLIQNPGTRAVAVQENDGATSNQVTFQILPNAPLVRALDPSSTIEGAGGVTVALLGERFQPGAVVRVVENQQPGARLNTTFVSSERLEARVPAEFTQTAGTVLLRVDNPDFGISNSIPLNVFIKDALVINEYLADPPGNAATDLNGDANGDGSRSSSNDEFVEIVNRTAGAIDISGYKLSDADEVRHVFAAGTIVPPFEAVVVFGGGKPTGAFGNAAADHLVFTASTGGLSLNNGGDTIRLEDAQGRILQEIKFGGAEGGANQAINRSPDINGATFARHTDVAGNASLLFSPGTRADGATFTIKPAIRSLAPASVHAASGPFTMTVSGSNFLSGAEVLFGQTTLVTIYRSDTLLEAQVGSGLVAVGGVVDVRVRNPKGETSSIAKFIVTEDPPHIARLSPEKTGTGAENLEIMVTGERFQQGAVAMIGTQTVETRFVSSTSLVIIAPTTLMRSAGTLTVRVTNADGNQSNPATLTVENGPLMTRLSPKRLKVGSGITEITIGGVAFRSGIVLYVNDVAVSTTFVSDTSFTARIPAALTSQKGSLTLQARHADGGRSNRVTLKVK